MEHPVSAARRYLDHLTVERGFSDNTLVAYRRDWSATPASSSDGGSTSVRDVDAKTVRAFVASRSASTHGAERAVQGDERRAHAVHGAAVPSVLRA